MRITELRDASVISSIKKRLCLIAGLGALVLILSCDHGRELAELSVKDGEVAVDTALMEERSPVFYYVDLENARVSFFLIRVDGEVRSFLDACENCYRFKKGYTVEGNDVICNYCRSRYPVDSLETGIGGCHPMPVEGTREGDVYHISLEELEKAGRFF